jgi:hypothetical protein
MARRALPYTKRAQHVAQALREALPEGWRAAAVNIPGGRDRWGNYTRSEVAVRVWNPASTEAGMWHISFSTHKRARATRFACMALVRGGFAPMYHTPLSDTIWYDNEDDKIVGDVAERVAA